MLLQSGLVTVVSTFFKFLNQFLFTIKWSVLPESTTRSLAVASLDSPDLRLDAKLPCLPPFSSFLLHAFSRCPFCLQKVHSAFSFITLRFHVAFHAATVAC